MAKEGIIKKPQHPWDFDPSIDTSKSYEAFCIYRDLGVNRSCAEAARILGKSYKIVSDWATANNWQERAIAYDLDQDKIRRDFLEKLTIEEHVNKLSKFRMLCENLGWANLELAADCLDISKKAIAQYREDPSIVLKPFEVKALASAGVSSAEIGIKLVAEALAVDKLLQQLPVDVEAEEVEE
ncbi:hypothetical protein NIES2100_73850 [Calothrix sp. NIES-2100]|uniref:hypothetical protein n=1 Tax=Calothrix sp. NIES-2100 TaxID=1954172 RepID=UPI000B601939|nr:hypothetical protein NIES2100_73850 [Calothrix sp. NIES-2100]